MQTIKELIYWSVLYCLFGTSFQSTMELLHAARVLH